MELATTLSTITPAHVLEDLKGEIVKSVRSIASAVDRSNSVSVAKTLSTNKLVVYLLSRLDWKTLQRQCVLWKSCHDFTAHRRKFVQRTIIADYCVLCAASQNKHWKWNAARKSCRLSAQEHYLALHKWSIDSCHQAQICSTKIKWNFFQYSLSWWNDN